MRKILFFCFIAALLTGCTAFRDAETDMDIYKGEQKTISIEAGQNEKEAYADYDPAISYQLPFDMDEDTKEWEKRYLEELKNDSGDYAEKWNLHIWVWYYRPESVKDPLLKEEGFLEYKEDSEVK